MQEGTSLDALFVLRSRDFESHPGKDGSASHVAKHSPNAAAARSFVLSGEIWALQSALGALSRHMSRWWPQPKQTLGNHLEVQKAFDTLQQYLVRSFVQQLVALDLEVFQRSSGAGCPITKKIEVIQNQLSKSLEEYDKDEIRWTEQGCQSLHLVRIVARAKRTCKILDLR